MRTGRCPRTSCSYTARTPARSRGAGGGSSPDASLASCERHFGRSRRAHQCLVHTTLDGPGTHTRLSIHQVWCHSSQAPLELWRNGTPSRVFTGMAQVSQQHQPLDFGSGHCVRTPAPPSPVSPPPTPRTAAVMLRRFRRAGSDPLRVTDHMLSACGMAGVGCQALAALWCPRGCLRLSLSFLCPPCTQRTSRSSPAWSTFASQTDAGLHAYTPRPSTPSDMPSPPPPHHLVDFQPTASLTTVYMLSCVNLFIHISAYIYISSYTYMYMFHPLVRWCECQPLQARSHHHPRLSVFRLWSAMLVLGSAITV